MISLHEAIIDVLREYSGITSFDVIADFINSNGTFRKAKGALLRPCDIRQRVTHPGYNGIFKEDGTLV